MGNEIKRKLAEIAKIDNLTPIEGADKIEVAQIRGWKIVVQKGLHEVGDLVVYFSIDSLLPIREEFEFLRKNSYVKNSQEGEGFRLKTIKLRGQVSQGLIIPIREIPEFFKFGEHWLFEVNSDDAHLYDAQEAYKIGQIFEEWEYDGEYEGDSTGFVVSEGIDVTELLGVKKYEKIIPAQLAGKIRGNFPSFIRKTDQERIQNFIGSFMKNYRDHEWECSLKLDGSSMTVYYYAPEDRFGVCSRNLDLTETEDNSFWQVARKNDMERKFREFSVAYGGVSFAVQGELVGPGIQGNPEQLKELEFYVFDVFNIDDQEYYDADQRYDVVFDLELEHVPVYERRVYGFDDADGFLEFAEHGFQGVSLNAKTREGLVFKSINDPNVSFKAISNGWLLSGGD